MLASTEPLAGPTKRIVTKDRIPIHLVVMCPEEYQDVGIITSGIERRSRVPLFLNTLFMGRQLALNKAWKFTLSLDTAPKAEHMILYYGWIYVTAIADNRESRPKRPESAK